MSRGGTDYKKMVCSSQVPLVHNDKRGSELLAGGTARDLGWSAGVSPLNCGIGGVCALRSFSLKSPQRVIQKQ